jgi:hypothetical protein
MSLSKDFLQKQLLLDFSEKTSKVLAVRLPLGSGFPIATPHPLEFLFLTHTTC